MSLVNSGSNILFSFFPSLRIYRPVSPLFVTTFFFFRFGELHPFSFKVPSQPTSCKKKTTKLIRRRRDILFESGQQEREREDPLITDGTGP